MRSGDDQFISRGRRFLLWLAAWMSAALAVLIPSFITMGNAALFVLIAFLAFPLGLVWFINPFWCNYDSDVGGYLVCLIWPVYIAMTIALFVIRQKWKYFLIYGIMCALLVLNVSGCHFLMHDQSVKLFHLNC